MLKGLALLLKLLVLALLLLLVLGTGVMDIDVGIVIVNHDDSSIGCVELNILNLVSSLGPLMCGLLIFLWLNLNLITHMTPVINAVHHIGGVSFYLFLV